MNVTVALYHADGREEPLGERDLDDLMWEFSEEEIAAARDELQRAGRYWLGGGAAPLYLVQRAPPRAPEPLTRSTDDDAETETL